MLFNSYIFIFAFLPITLLGYFIINHFGKFTLSKCWLVIASLVFYGYFNVNYLWIIVLSILFNYVVSQLFVSKRVKYSPVIRRVLLVLALLINIGILFFYKYLDFIFEIANTFFKGEKYYEGKLTDNLKYNIIPLIEDHPETTFTFYMVPYSIAYWYQAKCDGTLDAHFYDVRTALSKILKYDNTEVYFFQEDESIITNLDNYKDYTHFKPQINSYMSKAMAKGENKLTKENYLDILDDFYLYLNTVDYEAAFSA